ncbi:MAG TPA: TOBE domain-containing protein, partial [Gammaproteobacteria bacterium]|nr:TOBE domain-containing protein [Gammaproteobacteria bacterium]
RLQQVGTPRALYEAPANTFVAGFIGSPPMNLIHTVLHGDGEGLSVERGGRRLPLPVEWAARRPALGRLTGRPVIIGIRPEAIACDGGDGPHGVAVEARVTGVENLGHEKVIFFECRGTKGVDPSARERADHEGAAATLTARCRPEDPVAPGDTRSLSIDMNALHFFATDGGLL